MKYYFYLRARVPSFDIIHDFEEPLDNDQRLITRDNCRYGTVYFFNTLTMVHLTPVQFPINPASSKVLLFAVFIHDFLMKH